MSGGGALRVGIPASLRKTIQDIKEIAGKHSDEDIYAMLKECNMDPNETAQKLLYLDTFHEVKRKRDKKKPNVSNQVPEQNRWTSGTQRRGARGGRGNSSGYSSNDAGGGQRRSMQENGNMGRATAKTGLAGPVHHDTKNDAALSETSHPDDTGISTNLVTRSSVHGSATPNSEGNIFEIGHATSAAEINKPTKMPALSNVAVKPLQTLNPGPTPAPTPTIASTVAAEAGYQGKVSESTSNEILVSAPVSGVYSSASDPVLLPSLNFRNPGAVGTIKRETGIQRSAPHLSNSSLPEIRFNVCEDGVHDSAQVDPRPMSSNRKTFQGAEKDQHPEPSRPPALLNHNNASAAAPHQDGWSTKQANGSSNDLAQMGATVSPGATMPSLHNVDDSLLAQATSQLSRKLEGLNLTSQKPVIFPDHVQVPEAYRIGLTFGSLDGSLDNGVSEDAKFVDGTTLDNENVTRDPSLSLESASVTAHEGEYPGHHQSFPPMPENLSVLEVNGSPAALEMSEQSKPEIMPPVGGSPYPFLHAAPDYGFGAVSPLLAPHLMHVEGTEVANPPVSSTASSTQPLTQTAVGVIQNSASVSPPLFPYFRHPYPSNFFPYPPYLTQLYVPPNAPQFFGPGGFPQQASTGNIYMPPPTAGSGVKFPVPPIYKPETVPANLTHYGFPSGYGSYGSSPLGYGIGASFPSGLAPGSSSTAEDLTTPELKEKNIYPVLKQNDEPHIWTSASANFFYNFPAGQQVTYSSAPSGQGPLAGMYHLTATTATPSTVQSLPQHSQVMVGSVDSVVPPAGSYQQPHSGTGWNTKLLNRESI